MAELKLFKAIITFVRMEQGNNSTIVKKLIHRLKIYRFCKANGWRCYECIYHKHLFDEDGLVFRGTMCLYPKRCLYPKMRKEKQ